MPEHVNGWLGNAEVVLRDRMPLDLPYQVEVFANLVPPFDERLFLESEYVEKVRGLITNDILRARTILAEPHAELDGAGGDR